MLATLLSVLISVATTKTHETGLTTSQERKELAQAMKDAGKTGCAESTTDSWVRHVQALDMPQPEAWQGKY